jgi:hypothetical protein
MAKKLEIINYNHRQRWWFSNLFFAVSTDLISKAPLVPGSFTYSGLGAVALLWAGEGIALSLGSNWFRVGELSRRVVKALLMIRGIKRDRDRDRGGFSDEDAVIVVTVEVLGRERGLGDKEAGEDEGLAFDDGPGC